ncbi:MAG TPA: prolyl oligopeptidase family serine peptidase [Verrucomicrobiae bacterium]|nr:prolyl oligopeptidase family serine peptidase [Verrucomicrobiae bacterium]
MRKALCALALLAVASTLAVLAAEETDPFLWLEEVEGAKALAWAKDQNQKTTAEFEKVKQFKPIYDRTMQILDSQERIPYGNLRGDTVYNFWQDKDHPRGIWRRASLASYRTAAPAWETVIDLDAMMKADGIPWAWKGANCLAPERRLCIVSMSRGGSDAAVYREFDVTTKKFIEGGFSLPEAKSNVSWRDENTVWIGTDFGPGTTTTSGYPRVVKLWKRGTPLSEAKTVFEGETGDVASTGYSQFTPEGRYDFVVRTPAFFRQEMYIVLGDRLLRVDIPDDANPEGMFKDRMVVSLRSDWGVGGKTYRQGSLLAIGLDPFLRGRRDFDVLFEPSERISLQGVTQTRDALLVNTLDNVRGKLTSLTPGPGGWKREEIPLPGLGTVNVTSADEWQSSFFYNYADFLNPSSLFLVADGKAEKVKSAPRFFNADGMKVEQFEATSKDGTKIPYFLVTPKGFKADGNAPTLLGGYGGFEIPEVPYYDGVNGSAWLERGGVYAVANIRGGGEFGPAWHRAAQKENHHRNFEDFTAVAEDLITRKITSPKKLGIIGGSQGGLLVSGSMVYRPELFGAVVCEVPLADMKRFNKLLAGASWMAEYGNPDVPEEWAYIQKWSPYQNLKKDVVYPKAYFWTTTRDDRVHPAHARKMAAKMMDQGHPVYYFEQIEGGHGGGTVNQQKAYTEALEYAYLWKMLG